MTESKINEKELAKALIPLVGSEENINDVSHCVTRLRFILEDESLADGEAIEQLPGVVKVFSSSGQYQVVIGTAVAGVYEALADLLAAKKTEAEPTELQEEKQEPVSDGNSFRKMLGKFSAFFVACIMPLIPVLVSVGMIRTVAVVLGPAMLGLLDGSSGTIRILTLVGDAGFASLPVFIAWSASLYLKTNTVLAIFYGSFLIYPGLSELLGSGEAVSLFGIPVPQASYASQVVPVMLIMIAMYFLEKGLKKVLSETAQFIGMPILETLIMLPLMLCFLGPLGTILGNYLAKGTQALYSVAGPLCVALIGGFFLFICAVGMHTALIATALQLIRTQGYDPMALVGAGAAAYACFGLYLAFTIFEKDKRAKRIGLGALITHALGGVAEPGMFSLLLTRGQLMIIEIISAFLGSLYLGITGVGLHTPGISNFMAVLQYAGGGTVNFRNAAIGCAISFITAFILTALMQIRIGKSGSDE